MLKDEKIKKEEKIEKETSPLLERYIQRTLRDKMHRVDEEVIAEAIKTLLHEEKNKSKHLN